MEAVREGSRRPRLTWRHQRRGLHRDVAALRVGGLVACGASPVKDRPERKPELRLVAPLNACPLPPRLQGKRSLRSCNSPLAEVHLSHQRARRAAEPKSPGYQMPPAGFLLDRTPTTSPRWQSRWWPRSRPTWFRRPCSLNVRIGRSLTRRRRQEPWHLPLLPGSR